MSYSGLGVLIVSIAGLLDATSKSLGLWVHLALSFVLLQLAVVRALVARFVTIVVNNAVLPRPSLLVPFPPFLGHLVARWPPLSQLKHLLVVHFTNLHVFGIRLNVLAGNGVSSKAFEVRDDPVS